MKGIIFDLDMTLIDTSSLELLRNSKKWRQVLLHIESTRLFPGAKETIDELEKHYRIGIVTSSPRAYAEKLISYHGLNVPILAAYHDTSFHKPSPDPIILGIQKLALPVTDTFSIGDEQNDIRASESAGTISIGVTWGNSTATQLREAKPNFLVHSFHDLKEFFFPSTIRTSSIILNISDEFPELEGTYHLANYFKKSTRHFDRFSNYVLDFKNEVPNIVHAWSELAADALRNLINIDYIVRALGSDERVADGSKSLDYLCSHIAATCDSQYTPRALMKKCQTRELKHLSKTQRQRELENVYLFSPGEIQDRSRILIVDDVLTTGTTIRCIARQIRKKLPNAKITVFTLARTRDPAFGEPSDNSHLNLIDFRAGEDDPAVISSRKHNSMILMEDVDSEISYSLQSTIEVDFDNSYLDSFTDDEVHKETYMDKLLLLDGTTWVPAPGFKWKNARPLSIDDFEVVTDDHSPQSERTTGDAGYSLESLPLVLKILFNLLIMGDNQIKETANKILSSVLSELFEMEVPREMVSFFINALYNSDEEIRIASMWVLSHIQDPRTAYSFLTLLSDNSKRVAATAARMLADMNDADFLDFLKAAVSSSNESLSLSAAIILAHNGFEEGKDVLLSAIEDENDDVRIIAFEALQTLDAIAVPKLEMDRYPAPEDDVPF